MNIKSQVQEMDSMVSKGAIVDAVKLFFSETATTADYNNLNTSGKDKMVEKMEGFLGSIENVNGITHHRTISEGNISASEFTFDFDMKDGSKVLWHEIIQREWNEDGKVVAEKFFLA